MSKVDPFLFSMVRELVRPGMRVWDIGANVGLFAFAAASLGAHVVAVEPDIWLTNLLYRSVRANRLPVTVLPLALSDRTGVSTLHLSTDGTASNSLLGSGPSQSVVTVTLDWILDQFPPPQVLKIDVEGLEYAVLKGGARLLETRPVIFCEVTQDHAPLGELLKGAGYEFYAARETDRRPLTRPSRDTLAVPQS